MKAVRSSETCVTLKVNMKSCPERPKCSSQRLMSTSNCHRQPVLVAARSKASVCGRSLARIAGSNPTGGMDVCLLLML
jgi:hypothetical protein